MRKLLCLLSLHRPTGDMDPRWCLFFVCERCGARVVGELGRALERRR